MSDLKQAISLIKTGKKAEARRLLLAILRENADNEKAWLCMVSCAANSRQFNTSIRNVLRINPQNPTALKLAKQHQIAVNVNSGSTEDSFDYDYLETTQISSPTEALQQNVIDDALSSVSDILSARHLAEEETVIFEPDATAVGTKLDNAEKPEESKRNLVWLWFIAIAAVSIILAVIAFVALSAQNQDEQIAADETATSHYSTSIYISSTNDAILLTENSRATEFFATETLFFATDVAFQETLSAPTQTPAPTDTPLPDILPIEYIQGISVAFQIRGDPIQYEDRAVFRPNENIHVLLDVDPNAPAIFASVQLSRPTDENFQPISRTLRVIADSEEPPVFTFQVDSEWEIGDYVAQVFVDDIAGVQIEFLVANE